MNIEPNDDCPGATTDPQELLVLANQYALAARELFDPQGLPKGAVRMPATFCALHAIELYLNAVIRLDGANPKAIRKLQHKFAEKAGQDAIERLSLKKKTQAHLAELTDRRHYLVARYAPDQKGCLSRDNRLQATLDELAKKVGDAFDRRAAAERLAVV